MNPYGKTTARTLRTARRVQGAFYTPREVAAYITRQTLQSFLRTSATAQRPLRILDPACGDGIFLQEAYRLLLKRHGADHHCQRSRCDADGARPSLATRKQILLSHLFGVDQDEAAVAATRTNLARQCLTHDGDESLTARNIAAEELSRELAQNIRCGNALIEPDGWQVSAVTIPDVCLPNSIQPINWQTAFPDALIAGGFDAIIGNPPFINMRQLTRSYGEKVKTYFEHRYRCAHGAYDVYVLFMERAFQLLRREGWCGFVVPNKIASLGYAQPCRDLLLRKTTLLSIDDVAGTLMFKGAGVYPYILIWQKRMPRKDHRVRVTQARMLNELTRPSRITWVRQSELSPEEGLRIHGELAVEARVETEQLSVRARLHSGTTGFVAQQVASALIDVDATQSGAIQNFTGGQIEDQGRFEFIVSGNIDRYAILLGRVRFMKRAFHRAILPADALGFSLSAAKRQLYRGPKIVVAGMTRRLEAAWDPGGLALGVQVYALTEFLDDPRYLLGLLNSKLLTYLFRLRFQAKRLAGDYLAINKSQLAKLPIRTLDLDDPKQQVVRQQLIQFVESITGRMGEIRQFNSATKCARLQRTIRSAEREIDQLVYQLYDLTSDEAATVDREVVST